MSKRLFLYIDILGFTEIVRDTEKVFLLSPNGEKFWLVWRDCPTSVLEHEILAEAKVQYEATKDGVFFRNYSRFTTSNTAINFQRIPERQSFSNT